MKIYCYVGIFFSLLFFNSLSAQPSTVVSSTIPSRNALNIAVNTTIQATFVQDINAATCSNTTIRINGSLSGRHQASMSYNSSSRIVTITPGTSFSAGEVVTVTLTRGIKYTTEDSLPRSYSWQFTIKTNPSSGQFQMYSSVGVGKTPWYTATGDFDKDGFFDLAVVNDADNTVSILKNSGSGTFTPTATYNVGSSPTSIIAADFDGDGYLDLAVTNSGSSSLSLLKNNGNGTFSQTTIYSGGSAPWNLIAVDVNGDGALDLAVANYGSKNISVLKNNGYGVFTLYNVTATLSSNPYSITAADWDGDGKLDLAVACFYSNSVAILTNDGSGVFTQTEAISVGSNPLSVTAIDVDGDGVMDLAISNYGAGSISILKNNGAGSFVPSSTINTGTYPTFLTAIDINGDGIMDLLAPHTDSISVLLNNGSGAFTQRSRISAGIGVNTRHIIAADFDGDGILELAGVNTDFNNVALFKLRSGNASIRFSLSVLSWQSTALGSSKSQYLKIFNDGMDSTLIVNSIVSSNPAFSLNKITLSIPPLRSDSVLVTFTPGTSCATYTDSLIITSNDSKNPVSKITVIGTSVLASPVIGSPADSSAGWRNPIQFSWTKSRQVLAYTIQISGNTSFSSPLVNQSLADTTCSITSLSTSTKYYWRVRAENTSCASDWTLAQLTTKLDMPVLSSPASGASNVNLKPTLSWTNVFPAARYILQLSLLSDFSTVLKSIDTTATNIILDSLSRATIYYWRIKVYIKGDTTGFSNPYSFLTIPNVPPPPSSIFPGDASTNIPVNSSLKWSKVLTATSYNIQISTSPIFTTFLKDSTFADTVYKPKPLFNSNTQYFWRVKSINSGGSGSYSSTYRFTTSSDTNKAKISVQNINIGKVNVGQSKDTVLTITNTGNDDLIISTILSTNPAFSLKQSSFVLAASASANDSIHFVPSKAGMDSTRIILTSNAPSSPDTLIVTGVGAVYRITISPKTIALGTVKVGTRKDTIVSLVNTGNQSVVVFSVLSTSPAFTASPTQFTIPVNNTIFDTIHCAPTSIGQLETKVVYLSNAPSSPDTITLSGLITAVQEEERLPIEFSLDQNYPNPFNPATTIRYALSMRSHVKVQVINLLGQVVTELVNAEQSVGYQSVLWNATVASGMYFYRIEANAVDNLNHRFVDTKKMILLK